MIRNAKFADIPRICELMTELHHRSRYSKYKLDNKLFKELCMEAIRSGTKAVFVSEVSGVVEGFLMGVTTNLYEVLKVKTAIDQFFYVSKRDPRGASGLIDTYEKWAWAVPNVVVVELSATDAVQDHRRTAKFYERKGYVEIGILTEKERGHEPSI